MAWRTSSTGWASSKSQPSNNSQFHSASKGRPCWSPLFHSIHESWQDLPDLLVDKESEFYGNESRTNQQRRRNYDSTRNTPSHPNPLDCRSVGGQPNRRPNVGVRLHCSPADWTHW